MRAKRGWLLMRGALVVFALAGWSRPARGQDAVPLSIGQHVRITLSGEEARIEGQLVSTDGNLWVIAPTSGPPRTFEPGALTSAEVRVGSRGNLLLGTLLGLWTGSLAGGLTSIDSGCALVAPPARCDGFDVKQFAIYAGIGTGIGALIGKWKSTETWLPAVYAGSTLDGRAGISIRWPLSR